MTLDSLWTFINGFIDQMMNWSLPAVICVVLIGLCHALVCTATFPNKWIWFPIGLIGIILFIWGADASIVKIKGNPDVILGMYGFILSMFAVAVHVIAYRLLHERFPQLFNESDSIPSVPPSTQTPPQKP